MAKVKVEVLNAVVAGKSKGETVELSERQAKHLEAQGYVKLVEKEKSEEKPAAKKESDSKKSESKSKSKK